MTRIGFSVSLFNTVDLAADGSNIPRRSCEEYLTSVNYQKMIENKTGLGGLTHKDRRLRPELKGIVGNDDQVLINKNATHYYTRLYFKDNVDNFLYADAETLDPDLFAGEQKENIQNLIGFLASGIRTGISVVIQALWSKRNVAEKIINIKGFDFTQNPSFKGAGLVGDIETFSEIVNDPDKSFSDEQIKQFCDSNPDIGECKLQTRIYSSTGEVEIIDEDLLVGKKYISFDSVFSDRSEISLNDIIDQYGLFSEQYKIAKDVSKYSPITKDVLTSVAKNKDQKFEESVSEDHDDELDYWANKFADYTEDGDRNDLQVLFRGNRDNIRNIVRSVPEDEPNRDKLILTRLNQFFRVNPKTAQYSSISTVTERMNDSKLPRYTQVSRLVKSYQDYWKSKGSKLSIAEKNQQKLLFLQDINLLLKKVLPEIIKGKTFNSLYGFNRYGKEVTNASLELSSTYRRLLIAQKIMNFVPKGLQGEWYLDMRKFYKALIKEVYQEEVDDTLLDFVDMK